MKNEELQARFDVIVDSFDPSDDISVENANYEVHKNWQKFLKAGFDANLVSKMMSPQDIWAHYDDLISYGAEIDMVKLFSDFEEFFSKDFTKEHWKELLNRGVNPDCLIDRCYSDCHVFDTACLEDILTKDVSAEKAFKLIKSWLEFREEWPEEQEKILTLLYDHGLPKAEIEQWLKEHINSYMEDYIIDFGSDFYEKFGIEKDAVIDHWLDRYGYRFFYEDKLSDLPDVISVDRLINFFSMEEILDNFSPYSPFEDFIKDYLATGRNIDDLAQKYISEIGYSSDYSGFMFDLVNAGASIIDPEKFINSVDPSQLDDLEAEIWHDCLRKAGYDEKLISKFLR